MTDPSAIDPLQDTAPPAPPRSQWRDVLVQFSKHKGAMMGALFVILISFMVLAGPWLWGVDPRALDLTSTNLRPVYTALWDSDAKSSWAHPLGTDELGVDMLARLIAGGRASLSVGWTAMLLSLVIGTSVGVLSGYFHRLDGMLMRLTDLFLSLPILPLLLLASVLFRQPLRAAFGPVGGVFVLIVVVIGLTSWMPTARIVRGEILALKEREFVLAARSIGTRPFQVIRRHLLPNVLSPIMVSATLGLATAIITESALSFLGVGFPSDYATWGRMLADAVVRMEQYPERVMLPGIAISLTVLGVNYLGDGLRDALDPRIRGR